MYMDGRAVLSECDLTNTGVNFIFDLNSDYLEIRKQLGNLYPRVDTYIESGEYKEDICKVLPNITGCFINGKKVLSDAEILELRESKKEEYKAYKKDLFKSVTEDLKKSSGLQ